MTKAEGSRGRRVQSVEIGADLLIALADSGRSMSLSELAARVDMAPAKAHRYLASYVRCGLVDHQHSGRYDLGPAAARIGLAACARNDLVSRAGERLSEMVELTGATAMLSIWTHLGPTVIRMERSPNMPGGSMGIGFAMSLLETASGRACMAWMPRAATENTLERERKLRDGAPDEDTVRRIIEESREIGFVRMMGSAKSFFFSIAGPVLNGSGQLEAVVALMSYERERLETPEAEDLMRTGGGAQTWPHPAPFLRAAT